MKKWAFRYILTRERQLLFPFIISFGVSRYKMDWQRKKKNRFQPYCDRRKCFSSIFLHISVNFFHFFFTSAINCQLDLLRHRKSTMYVIFSMSSHYELAQCRATNWLAKKKYILSDKCTYFTFLSYIHINEYSFFQKLWKIFAHNIPFFVNSFIYAFLALSYFIHENLLRRLHLTSATSILKHCIFYCRRKIPHKKIFDMKKAMKTLYKS